MKNLILLATIVLFGLIGNTQDSVSMSDFNLLNNTKWKGTLTYKDYQSGKPTTIETKLQITIDGNAIKSDMQYVYEPNKNIKSVVKIKKNGTYYGNEAIISNTLDNNTRTLITSCQGKDNGKKATMFITHQFNKNNYTISKKVVFKKSGDSLTRNTYKFTKIK